MDVDRGELKKRIKRAILFHVSADAYEVGDNHHDAVDEAVGEIMKACGDCIENLEVPIPIEHWLGTKKHLSAETGRGIAKWFREGGE